MMFVCKAGVFGGSSWTINWLGCGGGSWTINWFGCGRSSCFLFFLFAFGSGFKTEVIRAQAVVDDVRVVVRITCDNEADEKYTNKSAH